MCTTRCVCPQTPRGTRWIPRDKVDRALETHVSKCPTAQSIKDSVEITWTADIVAA